MLNSLLVSLAAGAKMERPPLCLSGFSNISIFRREISETHQRILHARVSVNEEIRQQYTRLQRLRQVREFNPNELSEQVLKKFLFC